MLKFEGRTEKVNFAELEKGDWIVIDGQAAMVIWTASRGIEIQRPSNLKKTRFVGNGGGIEEQLFDKIVDGVIHIKQEL